MEELLKNKLGLQVLTDTGWSDFDALHIKGIQKTLTIKTDKATIVCTPTHKFYTTTMRKIEASEIQPRTKLYGRTGPHSVISIKLNKAYEVYDLINVTKNNRFYANDILVSNCEFIINDETLISSLHLVNMKSSEVIFKTGQVRWFKKPDPTQLYAIGLDPSLGTGSDPAAIQIIEVPSCIQIGEWTHNKTPVQKQVKILQEITHYLVDQGISENSIYYSVENNTLGEAALVAINEIGEENFKGTFLSERGRKYRKGFTTTHTSKLAACSKFKHLVEHNKFTVNSSNLLTELKNFIASGVSYKAKIGTTDDLVMSTLLCIRMIQSMQNFESKVDLEMRENFGEDYIMPFPFIMTTG